MTEQKEDLIENNINLSYVNQLERIAKNLRDE